MAENGFATGIAVDRPADHVVRLTIDRPPVNAIDSAAQRELTAQLRSAHDDTSVRAVVLTGAGTHFCGGADLREEQSIERDAVGGFLTGVGELLDAIRSHRVPVVAAIEGAAHGGGLEVALACDLRIGSTSCAFAAAGVNVGLVANFRALSQAIGDARARHLLLTGWTCRGEQALDWGLVTELVESDRLADRSIEIAERIASRAPLSVETTKDCLNRSIDLDSAEATELQGRSFARLFRTADHAEALRAFFEKRPGRYERT
ncbi:MAG: enoyl-CoA hydratase/isomerase family protein [Actinomycetota bacterium]